MFKKQRNNIITNKVDKKHITKNHIATIKLYLIGVILEVDILLKTMDCLISTNICGKEIKVIGNTDKVMNAGNAETKKLIFPSSVLLPTM